MNYLDFLAAVSPHIVGPLGGFFVTFLLLLGVARMHRTCEQKLRRVAAAYSELGVALNFVAGSELVNAKSLADVIEGKSAVTFKRRKKDDPISRDATGGTGDVR